MEILDVKLSCRSDQEHDSRVLKAQTFLSNLEKRSIRGNEWCPIRRREFSTLTFRNVISEGMISKLLSWSNRSRKSLYRESFSGASCTDSESTSGDYNASLAKILIHGKHKNIPVTELARLTEELTRELIKMRSYSLSEIEKNLTFFNKQVAEKKLPSFFCHNFYKGKSNAEYSLHRDSYETFATAVICLQESGKGLIFPDNDNSDSYDV